MLPCSRIFLGKEPPIMKARQPCAREHAETKVLESIACFLCGGWGLLAVGLAHCKSMVDRTSNKV